MTIACTGTALREATAAADLLAAEGIDATLLHFGTVKPFDADALVAAAARTRAVVTVEEHSIVAGFGSAVAEALAEAGVGAILRRVGLPDTFAHAVGSRDYLVDHYGLSGAAVANAARGLLGGARGGNDVTRRLGRTAPRSGTSRVHEAAANIEELTARAMPLADGPGLLEPVAELHSADERR